MHLSNSPQFQLILLFPSSKSLPLEADCDIILVGNDQKKSVTAFSWLSSFMDQYIYHIPTAVWGCPRHHLKNLFLGVFVEICPQGDSIYSEIFQMCSGDPLRSQGILHQSHSGDSEESQLAQGLLQAFLSLLISCCWQGRMPGGMWAEKGDPEEQVKWQPTAGGDTSEETRPNTLQHSRWQDHYKMNTMKTIIISLSKPTATSVLKYVGLFWSQKPSWSISN